MVATVYAVILVRWAICHMWVPSDGTSKVAHILTLCCSFRHFLKCLQWNKVGLWKQWRYIFSQIAQCCNYIGLNILHSLLPLSGREEWRFLFCFLFLCLEKSRDHKTSTSVMYSSSSSSMIWTVLILSLHFVHFGHTTSLFKQSILLPVQEQERGLPLWWWRVVGHHWLLHCLCCPWWNEEVFCVP